ncbi:uncharacterized protein LOC126802626 [Argentina anserina]|uniref:uncharacterized protein LOC126802626 n=1 Tax=Argentina anserina TaxID=57926 RepID=UPI00217623B1|nr:uncharacterized protein LOC126802626 [Potentilla anserina]
MNHEFDGCLLTEVPEHIENMHDNPEAVGKEALWYMKNNICNNIIRATMSEAIEGTIPEIELAYTLLQHLDEKFMKIDKSKSHALSLEFSTLKYIGVGGVRDHVLKMECIVNKLKELDFVLPDKYMVNTVLQSLPPIFNQLKSSYFAQKDNWGLISS